MARYLYVAISIMALIVFLAVPQAFAVENKWTELVKESGRVLADIQEMPDQSVPDDLLRSCAGIAVIPSTISAGLGIGGKYGQGIIIVRDEKTHKWSCPAIFTLVGGSFGFQIGGQATDIVLLIMNRRSVDGLLQSKFKLGGDASVSAGPVGRNAEASMDAQLKGGILSYSRSRGLFAGIKLEGAVITQHWEADNIIYGKSVSAQEILVENKTAMPKCAGAVLKVLNKYPYKK